MIIGVTEPSVLLQKDSNPTLNTVTAYGDDYLEINRVRFWTAISFTPEGPIRSLDLNSPADIDAELLRGLAGLKDSRSDPLAFLDDAPPALPPDAPEVILIGTGARQTFLSPAVTGALLALGIGIEIMTTQAAARTYNILMSEERRVLALLLPGDPKP
uniref:Mth938-like domain-containing protein n=1 Tax=Castellaniella defragrans TaxID=75697 RepID=UPI00334183DC